VELVPAEAVPFIVVSPIIRPRLVKDVTQEGVLCELQAAMGGLNRELPIVAAMTGTSTEGCFEWPKTRVASVQNHMAHMLSLKDLATCREIGGAN